MRKQKHKNTCSVQYTRRNALHTTIIPLRGPEPGMSFGLDIHGSCAVVGTEEVRRNKDFTGNHRSVIYPISVTTQKET